MISVNYNTKIPLRFYNFLADGLAAKEEELSAVSGSFVNPDVVNPNSYTRTNAYPVTIRSSMPKDEQVRNNDLVNKFDKNCRKKL